MASGPRTAYPVRVDIPRRFSLIVRAVLLPVTLVAALACARFAAAEALAPPTARQLPAGCLPVCQTSCLKPFALPDRWDDVTPIAGHDDWRDNELWDRENFQDSNGNGLYDPGETFSDTNGNGQYDSEAYNGLLTGYIPDPYPGNRLAPNGDFGLQLVLKAGVADRSQSSHYHAIELPAINRGTPASGAKAFREHIETCSNDDLWPGDRLAFETGNMAGPTAAGVQVLIARDPAARFDPATREIVGSIFPPFESPRLVYIGLTDPRIGAKAGRAQVQVVKITAFFLEELDGAGSVRGRFLKVHALGPPCGCCGDLRANWLRDCP